MAVVSETCIHVDGLVQERRNSSALAMGIHVDGLMQDVIPVR